MRISTSISLSLVLCALASVAACGYDDRGHDPPPSDSDGSTFDASSDGGQEPPAFADGAVACDGPEDCAADQVCCGNLGGGGGATCSGSADCNGQMLCHTSDDCPSTMPFCCGSPVLTAQVCQMTPCPGM